MRLVLLLFLVLFVAAPASASCMRWSKPPPSAERPDVDGPGSFGPLHETVSLDCLQYVGYAAIGDVVRAELRDENGDRYLVQQGMMVGENAGRIVEITEARITIEQLVRGTDGEFVPVLRYLFRTPPAE